MERTASKDIRLLVLERAKGRCEACKCPPDWRGLSVHHLYLKGMGGTKREYGLDDLIALCGRCHSAAHGIQEVPSQPRWGATMVLEEDGFHD